MRMQSHSTCCMRLCKQFASAGVADDVLVAKCELDMLLLLAHGSALLHNLCMHVTHIVATCARAACTADEEHGFYESLFRNSRANCTRSRGRCVLAACCCTAVLPVSNHITIMHEYAMTRMLKQAYTDSRSSMHESELKNEVFVPCL